jgi:hypothetical protein
MLDNGFKLIYHNGGGAPAPDATTLWKATEVVFEPKSPTDHATIYVDPLGATQPWRIGFAVQGFPNTATSGNELMAYLGTAATLTSTGINRNFSFPVVLLQGGGRSADTRISATKVHGYRISITQRGVAMLVWNPKNIESMTTMGLLCVQRPVKSDGATLTDGFSPVFAVHNTDPMSGGRPAQSGRFFRTTVRERDVNLPQKSTSQVVNSKRHATGSINFRRLADSNGVIQHKFVIGGVKVWLGTDSNGPPQSQDNNLVYIPTAPTGTDPLAAAASYYATQLSKSTQKALKELTFSASGPNILIYANVEGEDGNKITFTNPTTAGGVNSVISPSNGTLGGGGGKAVADTGTIRIVTNPTAGGSSYIRIGTTPPLQIDFVNTNPSSTSTTSEIGTTPAVTAANLESRLRQLQPVYAQLQGVSFKVDAANADTVVVSNETLASGSLWTQTSGNPPVISVTTPLTGGSSNIASGYVNFLGVPNAGSVLRLNGVDITFVYGLASGDSQVSIGSAAAPSSSDTVMNELLAKLTVHPDSAIQAGQYTMELSGVAPVPYVGRLTIASTPIGIEGNTYTMYSTTAQIEFTHVGLGFTTSLTGGAGFAPTADTAAFPDEISELTGTLGASMYRFPNVWNAPVTTDTGEYVLVFPFGFCTERVAFTEEMDMIAVSKGAAYQGVQNVNINVYTANRTYTSYNSNRSTTKDPDDFVRIFLLTSGGGI